jgi:hypothetical protein
MNSRIKKAGLPLKATGKPACFFGLAGGLDYDMKLFKHILFEVNCDIILRLAS